VSRYRFVVLGVGFLAQASFSAALFAFAVLSPALEQQFDVGLGAIGVALAASSGGMTLTLLGWGLLTDRVGERSVISIGLSIAAGFLGLAAAADDFVLLVVLVTLAGMAGAAVNAATGRAVMSWFPASERGLALGIRQTAVPVGAGVGALVLPALESHFGLGAAFLALAGGCAVAALAAFTWLRDAPGFPEDSISGHVVSPLRDRRLWQLAAGSTLLVSVQIALTGFLVLYLHRERGLSPAAAGAVLAAINVAGAVLRIGLGRLSDRIGSRLLPLRRLSLTLSAAMAAAAALTEAPDWVVVAALAVAGALSVGWNGLSFTATAELAGRERSGAALGFQQTALGLGSMIAPLAFAALVSATSWTAGFAVLAVLPLGAFATFGPLLAAEERRRPAVRPAR
jgi:sugar phosphate permease